MQSAGENLFIYGSFGIPGGIGHALVDLYTPLLLSVILDIRFLYNGIETVPIAEYDLNIRGIAEHERLHPWDGVFGLRSLFPTVEDAGGLYDETLRIPGHGRWSLFNMGDVQKMKKLVQACRDDGRRVLFEIAENERLWYWQVVHWEQLGLVDMGTTRRFRDTIRAPFRQNIAARYSRLPGPARPRVSVHIRNSGEWPDRPDDCALQKSGAARISQWLDVPVDIYSEGQDADLERIRALYQDVPVNIHFNEDTVESFLALATSDVLLGGKSSFYLFAGLLSPGLKVTWHDYDTALLDMVTHKQDRMVLDEEWLTVSGELDRGAFMRSFEARRGV